MINKRKVLIVLLSVVIIVVLVVVAIKSSKKESIRTEAKDNHDDVSTEQENIQVEVNQDEVEPQEEKTEESAVVQEKTPEYTNVLSKEGVSEQLINDDKAIDFITKYVALINGKDIIDKNVDDSDFKQKIKLYITLESIINTNDSSEIPKSIVELAYKELFGDEKIDFKDAYLFKYDKNKDIYIKAGATYIQEAHIVKIDRIDEKDGYKEVEFRYAFNDDKNSDCYKTTIKLRNNNEYSFSKYRIIDIDKISSQAVGKVSDN